MTRRTDYSRENYIDVDIRKVADNVKTKIHKEPLTPDEIASYLSIYGNSKKSISKRTVENYIREICEHTSGLLSINDFKIQKKYVIPPQYQGLLLVLLDTDYFDGRKNTRHLFNREELYSSLVRNIDQYLLEDDRYEIKSHPAYINALLESELTKRLSNELVSLIRFLLHSDSIIRFDLMRYVITTINDLTEKVSSADARTFAEKLTYAATIRNENGSGDTEIKAKKIKSDSLEELILICLAERVRGIIKPNLSNCDGENLNQLAIYSAALSYQIEFSDTDVRKMLSDIDDAMYSNERFKHLEQKAKQILDLTDPLENIIYQNIVKTSKILLVAPYISSEEYEWMREFIQESMQKDKWDILNEFMNR